MQRVTKRPVWAIGVAMTMCCTATLAVGRQATPSPEWIAAARAELARQATMPDTPGTGKFPAIKEEVASPRITSCTTQLIWGSWAPRSWACIGSAMAAA